MKVSARKADRYGIVIEAEASPIGVWSWHDDAMKFRALASWQAILSAPDAESAHTATIDMVRTKAWKG